MNESWPARMSLIEKIERLQISEESFEFYCSTFIKNWSRYRLKKIEGDWFLVKNKRGKPVHLTKDMVAYHLLGKFWVSTFPVKVARFLCLDIDHSPDQLAIYRIVKDWLKHPLVLQSSERGGLHVYAFLSPDFPICWSKLLNLTKTQLLKRGIDIKPGTCEVFLEPNVSLRLPLGKGSFLLDPGTLQPFCTDVAEAIRFIEKTITPFSLQDLFPGLQEKLLERQ